MEPGERRNQGEADRTEGRGGVWGPEARGGDEGSTGQGGADDREASDDEDLVLDKEDNLELAISSDE